MYYVPVHGIDSINYGFFFLFLSHDTPPSKKMELRGSVNDKLISFNLFHQIIIFIYRSNLVNKFILGSCQLNVPIDISCCIIFQLHLYMYIFVLWGLKFIESQGTFIGMEFSVSSTRIAIMLSRPNIIVLNSLHKL